VRETTLARSIIWVSSIREGEKQEEKTLEEQQKCKNELRQKRLCKQITSTSAPKRKNNKKNL